MKSNGSKSLIVKLIDFSVTLRFKRNDVLEAFLDGYFLVYDSKVGEVLFETGGYFGPIFPHATSFFCHI